MNTTKREQIWESLQDPEFRNQFINEHINVGIAFQIHGLRERQGLKQKQLAERLGDEKKQPLISAWENPNYGKYTLGTLKDLAKAFDVGLLVRFVPFSRLVDWTINLTHDVSAPPSFNEEQSHAVIQAFTTPNVAGGIRVVSADDIFNTEQQNTNVATNVPAFPMLEKEPAHA